MSRAPVKAALVHALLSLHKRVLSPLLHVGFSGACRFQPSCSEYAALALHHHGPARGAWLSIARFLRCHPGCAGGFDPVPGTWPLSGLGPAPHRRPATAPLPPDSSPAPFPPRHLS